MTSAFYKGLDMSTSLQKTDDGLIIFTLPDIGEGVAEGEIIEWLVNEGDTVAEDQSIVEVMTDKVTVEIPAPRAGTIVKFYAAVGDVVDVGAPLVAFSDVGAGPVPARQDHTPAEIPHPSPTPSTNELKQASLEAEPTPTPEPATSSKNDPAPKEKEKGSSSVILAAPATRQLAKSLNVPICQINGSGPHGRVMPHDVETYSQRGATALQLTPTTAVSAPFIMSTAPPLINQTPVANIVPYTGMRKRIGERLLESHQNVPSFAYVEEIRMDRVEALRQELKPTLVEQGIKLSPLTFVMRAVTLALVEFPPLNSQLDTQAAKITQPDTVNLGLAVDTPQGLIVPVIQKAHQHSLLSLAVEIQRLGLAAREQKLSREDVQGATFTVSSIGSIGGVLGIPIINPPESAIMGVNQIRKMPVVDEHDHIVVGRVMNLSLSADHRVVDGADAARFMNRVKALLESPSLLLL